MRPRYQALFTTHLSMHAVALPAGTARRATARADSAARQITLQSVHAPPGTGPSGEDLKTAAQDVSDSSVTPTLPCPWWVLGPIELRGPLFEQPREVVEVMSDDDDDEEEDDDEEDDDEDEFEDDVGLDAINDQRDIVEMLLDNVGWEEDERRSWGRKTTKKMRLTTRTRKRSRTPTVTCTHREAFKMASGSFRISSVTRAAMRTLRQTMRAKKMFSIVEELSYDSCADD